MSARPELARMPEEELTLLISRYLDGDLSPEEAQELERHLARDPEARRRHAEMAALVEALGKLPSPEPPFALSTRVAAQVQERTKGLGGFAQRFGFFPSPAMVAAVTGGLALVLAIGVYRGTLGRKPVSVADTAEKTEAPVRVFLQDSVKDHAAAPAPQAAPAEAGRVASAPARSDAAGKSEAAPERDALARNAPEELSKRKASSGFAPEVAAAPGKETENAAPESFAAAESREAPAAPAPAVAGVMAAARDEAAPRSRAQAAAPSLSIVPRAGRRETWKLPAGIATGGVRGPLDETYRLWLDAGGHVGSITPLTSPPPVRADVEGLLRGLVLVPEPGVTPSPDVDVRLVAH